MIAIDPGASGGIAYDSKIVGLGAVKMPETDRGIITYLSPRAKPVENSEKGAVFTMELEARVAYLEDLVLFRGAKGKAMPSSRMAPYAGNWGFVRGALTAFGYRIVVVKPQVWQKALGLGDAKGLTRTQWKNKLKNKAEQLFPQIKVTLATADALLILEAARRGLIG